MNIPLSLVARRLAQLHGQIATPPGFPRDALAFIRENRLAVFHEWPSGHWSLTDAGRDFIAEHGED